MLLFERASLQKVPERLDLVARLSLPASADGIIRGRSAPTAPECHSRGIRHVKTAATLSLHIDRAAGGHCHHCRADRVASPGGAESPRSSEPDELPKQLAAVWDRLAR